MRTSFLLLFYLLSLGTLIAEYALAQSTSSSDFSINEDNINQVLATNILFSAQRTISSGQFYFGGDSNRSGSTLTVAKLPGRFTFEKEGRRF